MVLFVLALLSKSQAVTLPVLFILFDYLFGKEVSGKSILVKWPFFLFAIAAGLYQLKDSGGAAYTTLDIYNYVDRVLFSFYGMTVYLYKLIIPYKLSAFYPYPSKEEAYPIIFYLSPVIIIGIGVAVWRFLKNSRITLFAFLFLLVHVVLLLQFLNFNSSIVYDRFTYVAYLGFFLLAGHMYVRLNGKEGYIKHKLANIFNVGLITLVALFSIVSYTRSQVWENSETLWSDVISNFPEADIAFLNRGLYYLEDDQNGKAMADMNEAINLNEQNEKAFNNRGRLHSRANDFESAINDYGRAIEIRSNYADPYYNRGELLGKQGKMEEAIRDFLKAIELKPNYYLAFNNLGIVYNIQEKFEEAISNYSQSIAINPNYGTAFLNRSYVYASLEQYQNAYQDALKAGSLGTVVDQNYLNEMRRLSGN